MRWRAGAKHSRMRSMKRVHAGMQSSSYYYGQGRRYNRVPPPVFEHALAPVVDADGFAVPDWERAGLLYAKAPPEPRTFVSKETSFGYKKHQVNKLALPLPDVVESLGFTFRRKVRVSALTKAIRWELAA